jgi:hypothetical protein
VDGCGWAELPARLITPETRRAALEQARREYAGPLANFHLGGPSCDALRELLALCRHEGIPVALLWMPEAAVFRGWYPPAAQKQIDAYLAELDVPLIDARHWLADEEFADGHHLLPHGVEVFSDRLGREALPPLLRRLPRKRDASASREEP